MNLQNSNKIVGIFNKGFNLKNAKRKVTFSSIFMPDKLEVSQIFLNTQAQSYNSIAPDLWNYTTGSATWVTKDCYKGCKVSNTAAADVPVVWGGSK